MTIVVTGSWSLREIQAAMEMVMDKMGLHPMDPKTQRKWGVAFSFGQNVLDELSGGKWREISSVIDGSTTDSIKAGAAESWEKE